MTQPYYGPTGEDRQTIEYERTFIAGDVITGVGYGIQLTLYISCVHNLWTRKEHTRQRMFLLGYITLMLLIGSLYVAVQARTVQFVYIDNRNYPGGPWTFFLNSQTAAVNVIFYATLFLLTLLSDLFVLWRCWVIWAASGHPKLAWGVIAFPIVLLLFSFVMGTLWVLESSQPFLSLYSALPMAYGTSYYTLSLGVNIILTLLIIGRLLVYRRNLLENLTAAHGAHYISLITIIVESAALYSLFALLFLITYAINHPTNQVWLAVASPCQQIANLLIVYRVVDGSAWNQNSLSTTGALPSIRFQTETNRGHIATHISSFHLAVPPPSERPEPKGVPQDAV
ncbi:hypothetical protein DFH08DRAFT_935453 [Mycena albidolilacea]|uniref:Uncharacterized protein n=1 Tax=Mycena albidolilacea TaxID=1033008 RepID=A0AAD7A7L2_9AGAR|nr:hypothetical protein DFH08DRAFT_935453 [Mycena albidolilacea]